MPKSENTPSAETLERLSIAIVEDLFVNGNGDHAERLVLTSAEGRNLGGWGKLPMQDRILRLLEETLHAKP